MMIPYLSVALSLSLLSVCQSTVVTFLKSLDSRDIKTFSKLVLSIPAAGDDYVATADFSPASDHSSNFAQLKIKTNALYSDMDQMYAAGYLEGYLSAESIYQHYQNMMCQVDCSGYVPPELKKFFSEQELWVKSQVENHSSCPYWNFVGGLDTQLEGLMAGYRESAFAQDEGHTLLPWAFTMLNSLGDLFDVIPAVTPSKRPNFERMNYQQIRDYSVKNGHCSALVKMTDDLSEIYMGHSSWFVYSAMLRIYKTYEFALSNEASQTSMTAFSSYPGMLSSLDDFYMMEDSKLVMLQTTNSIYNSSLWDLVKPTSLLAWQRVRTANQLSSSGPDWYNIVAKHNSGTYNNQYMIIDGKKFLPKNALQKNTLFVVEQIPGHVAGSDVTRTLEMGYWPSFNVPYHQDIYLESGYDTVDEKNNQFVFSEYQLAPRAEIFRREEGGVTDLTSMQAVMRFNEFQTDPYSGGSAWGAICARGDLDVSSPYSGGGYDTKITTWSQLMGKTSSGDESSSKLEASIVNGPTAQNQKPFVWSTSGLDTPDNLHLGQPDVFDFEFEFVNSNIQ